MNAIAKQDFDAPVNEGLQLATLLDRVISDPNIDLDRIERLLQMQERIIARRAEMAYTTAFAAMQAQLPAITERGAITNNQGKVQSTYALWEDTNDIIKPILAQHDFALSFPKIDTSGGITVTAKLRHTAGHSDEVTITLPVDTSGSKNGVQGVGSSLSYAKRYAAGALLNLTSRGEDDDGVGAEKSGAADVAMQQINLCDTVTDLIDWQKKHYDGLAKVVSVKELDTIIALWNRRKAAMKAKEQV